MILAALRRLAIVVAVLAFATVVAGAVLAVATGHGAQRGATVALYAVGALCTVLGAGVAIRNAAQLHRPWAGQGRDPRDAEVDRDLAGTLLAVGLALVLFGVVLDEDARLV